MERWKDIEGYEGIYQVSNEGRVRSLERTNKGGNQYGNCSMQLKEKILAFSEGKYGHLSVKLYKDGIKRMHKVHVLVAEAFIPNTQNYDVVHHIDHNPQNNHVENLVWMNRGEHTAMHKAKKVFQYSLDNKLIGEYVTTEDIHKQLGYAESVISRCCNGGYYSKTRKKWVNMKQSYGYKWSYEPL